MTFFSPSNSKSYHFISFLCSNVNKCGFVIFAFHWILFLITLCTPSQLFLELSISLRCQTCFWIMLPGFCLNLDQCDSAGRAGYVQITGFSQVKHAVLQLFHSCSIIISSVCFVISWLTRSNQSGLHGNHYNHKIPTITPWSLSLYVCCHLHFNVWC